MKKTVVILSLMLVMLAACQTAPEVVPEEEVVETIISPESPQELTVNGETISLAGEGYLSVGDSLTMAELIKPVATFDKMESVSLSDYSGWKVFHIVPSLDTPTCSFQTKQIEEAAGEFSDVSFITISADLPFALNRFCGDNEIENMLVLSDYRHLEFGRLNHFLLEDIQLLTRAIFIVDDNNVVQYIEYASEVTNPINVVNALHFLRQNKPD